MHSFLFSRACTLVQRSSWSCHFCILWQCTEINKHPENLVASNRQSILSLPNKQMLLILFMRLSFAFKMLISPTFDIPIEGNLFLFSSMPSNICTCMSKFTRTLYLQYARIWLYNFELRPELSCPKKLLLYWVTKWRYCLQPLCKFDCKALKPWIFTIKSWRKI